MCDGMVYNGNPYPLSPQTRRNKIVRLRLLYVRSCGTPVGYAYGICGHMRHVTF